MMQQQRTMKLGKQECPKKKKNCGPMSFTVRPVSCVSALFPCLHQAVSQIGITTLDKHDYQLIVRGGGGVFHKHVHDTH